MRKRNIAVLLLTVLLLAGLTGCARRGDTIVLLASVYARDPGRRSGLTAGETYTDWPIVLERRGSGWHVVSSGY